MSQDLATFMQAMRKGKKISSEMHARLIDLEVPMGCNVKRMESGVLIPNIEYIQNTPKAFDMQPATRAHFQRLVFDAILQTKTGLIVADILSRMGVDPRDAITHPPAAAPQGTLHTFLKDRCGPSARLYRSLTDYRRLPAAQYGYVVITPEEYTWTKAVAPINKLQRGEYNLLIVKSMVDTKKTYRIFHRLQALYPNYIGCLYGLLTERAKKDPMVRPGADVVSDHLKRSAEKFAAI